METKYSKKQLHNLLKRIESVKVTNWNILCDVVESIKNGEAVIIKKEWEDKFKNDHPEIFGLNLSDMKNRSTYQECFDLHFSINKNKLMLKATIYDGDNYRGYRVNKRFTTEIYLPYKFILKIDKWIGWGFDNQVEKLYDQHLENLKQDWIRSKKHEIISNLKSN